MSGTLAKINQEMRKAFPGVSKGGDTSEQYGVVIGRITLMVLEF